jgi:hypothetical protein
MNHLPVATEAYDPWLQCCIIVVMMRATRFFKKGYNSIFQPLYQLLHVAIHSFEIEHPNEQL